jgi:two-component system, NtrC family, sensor histidine kinase PilS
VDVAEVLRGTTALVQSHPDCDGVRITCVVPDERLVVQGDEDLLHRALFNLTLNAVQASPPGGEVRVDAEVLDRDAGERHALASRFEPGSVMVRVTDEGPGIPPEHRARLFDPFFTTRPGGSGLGLAVVHRAIEAHRGVVFFDSGSRPGTRFTVILPRTRGPSAVPAGAVV